MIMSQASAAATQPEMNEGVEAPAKAETSAHEKILDEFVEGKLDMKETGRKLDALAKGSVTEFKNEGGAKVISIGKRYDTPITGDALIQSKEIDVAADHAITVLQETLKAELGDILPEKPKPEPIHQEAELTSPKPEPKPEVIKSAYESMTMGQLQNEYERLFNKTEEDLKANPKLKKEYKKAAKSGGFPEDPGANDAEINKVYDEIQKRRRAERAPLPTPQAVPAEAKAEPPPATHHLESEVTMSAPDSKVEAHLGDEIPMSEDEKLEKGYKEASTAYFKRYDKTREYVAGLLKGNDEAGRQKAEGYLKGLILTAENISSDDMLADGMAQGLITKEQLEAVSNSGKIETFQDEVVSHLKSMLKDVEGGAKTLVHEEQSTTSIAEDFLKGAVDDGTRDKAEKVIDWIQARTEKLQMQLSVEVKQKLAGKSDKEKLNLLGELRKFKTDLDDPKFLEHALKNSLGVQRSQMEKLSDGDILRIQNGLRKYYEEAIRLANKEIGY